jgi:hypothetical protein
MTVHVGSRLGAYDVVAINGQYRIGSRLGPP